MTKKNNDNKWKTTQGALKPVDLKQVQFAVKYEQPKNRKKK